METEQLVTALVVAVMALGKTVMEAEERVQVEGETVLVKQAMAAAGSPAPGTHARQAPRS